MTYNYKLKLKSERDRDCLFNVESMRALYKLSTVKPEDYLSYMVSANLPENFYLDLWNSIQSLAKRLLESEYLYYSDRHYQYQIDAFLEFYNDDKDYSIHKALEKFRYCFIYIDVDEKFFDNFFIIKDFDDEIMEEFKEMSEELGMDLADMIIEEEKPSNKKYEPSKQEMFVDGHYVEIAISKYNLSTHKRADTLKELVDSFDTEKEAVEYIKAHNFEFHKLSNTASYPYGLNDPKTTNNANHGFPLGTTAGGKGFHLDNDFEN